MTDELKPVRCGCGGEAVAVSTYAIGETIWHVLCKKCRISTHIYYTESEAVTAWNRAMGKEPVKVKTVTAKNGHSWIECSRCHQEVGKGFPYCAGCGAKLDWSGND